jgi:hypothetical protein
VGHSQAALERREGMEECQQALSLDRLAKGLNRLKH